MFRFRRSSQSGHSPRHAAASVAPVGLTSPPLLTAEQCSRVIREYQEAARRDRFGDDD